METPTRTISVTGHASAPAVPDIATAHLSIETLAGSVEEAFAQSGRTLDALRDTLHSAGVEPRDIATTDRSLRAERKWRDGHDDGLLGYVARGTVRVTLRSLPAAAGILQSAIAAGGEQARLEGFSLEVSDPTAVRSQAREAAWQDALARASQLAASSGVTLGQVLRIEEGSAGGGLPPIAFARVAAAPQADGAIQAGEQEVQVSLGVTWSVA
ncbi:SIMPL domain-containing protein [Arthrobacter woluwensis]|uniref:SIMPL domain-containing protein n=1 Tax=Arthrobacter woluwensis TaxID=156980 RepID=UPI001AAFA60D|nr:SIMPL domain-containing protein [Arthrobacter woluwensis]QTF71068.1 SIMPL domain-containing protein [Arthrobacter woluwensis]